MYIVTGGSGFIGSNIVKSLNEKSFTDILVVDDLEKSERFRNLSDCIISDYMDKKEFLRALESGNFADKIKVVFHQGACTDTMEQNGRYMMMNNYSFSKSLLNFVLEKRIPFIYASSAAVYGSGSNFSEIPENEHPINVYGFSKLVFDQHVRNILPDAESTVAGLRYFNVYGPREFHKEKMASMIFQLYRQIQGTGVACLFKGTDGYGDGEQCRDFINVEDVVKVNLFLAEDRINKGIFNVGTGISRSFNDLASILIRLLGKGSVEYIPFDSNLTGKYQSFTEADISSLRKAGYREDFLSIEDGIAKTVSTWIKNGI